MYAFIMIVGVLIAIKNNYYAGLAPLAVCFGFIFTYFITELLNFKFHIYEDKIEWKTLWGKHKIIHYSDVQNINIDVHINVPPFNIPDIYIQGIDSGIIFRPFWLGDDGTDAANLILSKCNHIQFKEGFTRHQRNYLKIQYLLRLCAIALVTVGFCKLFCR